MIFRIHVDRARDGEMIEDSVVIEGDSIEDIQSKAEAWLKERNLQGASVWSEEL